MIGRLGLKFTASVSPDVIGVLTSTSTKRM